MEKVIMVKENFVTQTVHIKKENLKTESLSDRHIYINLKPSIPKFTSKPRNKINYNKK